MKCVRKSENRPKGKRYRWRFGNTEEPGRESEPPMRGAIEFVQSGHMVARNGIHDAESAGDVASGSMLARGEEREFR